MNIAGNAAGPASAAPSGDGITAGMTPVQKDCWAIFNHPDNCARESGAGIDEVRLQAGLQCVLGAMHSGCNISCCVTRSMYSSIAGTLSCQGVMLMAASSAAILLERSQTWRMLR